ncbi:hypothetical protein C8Q76DRAFT_795174 [Earliella scabrosa]|nr:hypothetical protein C8Q76DRAFT_795174 [Earliella scabrosa]
MVASEERIRDWDEIAESLGLTPVHDPDTGEIVSLGRPEGAAADFYVVWEGRAVGIFCNWGLANAMVNSFPGAAYKKFKTLQAARLAWAQGPRPDAPWQPPRPRAARRTPGRDQLPAASSGSGAVPGRETARPVPAYPSPAAEVLPRPPVRVVIPRTASTDGSSSDDDYWEDATAYLPDAAIAAHPANDDPALSPTISSVSSLSLSSSLLTGTISPRTIDTPALPLPQLPSPVISNADITRTRDTHPPPIRTQARPGHDQSGTMTASTMDSVPVPRQTKPAGAQPASDTRRAGRSRGDGKTRTDVSKSVDVVVVPKQSRYWVVVRGDSPGIYVDRNTALVMLGTSPGMKIVVFESLSRASLYFVQQYMAGNVGVPLLVVQDE